MPARLLIALAALLAAAAAPRAQVDASPDTTDAAPNVTPTTRPRSRPVARPLPPRGTGAHRLSGPRFGITVLSGETVRRINETYGDCTYDQQTGQCRYDNLLSESLPIVTQFGWQFERQMAQASNGLALVTETVLLVGGLERGLALPSASLIVGVRTPGGLELGLGPNLSATGAAYALTAGFSNPVGEIKVPINLAAVLGRDGPRVSLLVGLTFSDSRY